MDQSEGAAEASHYNWTLMHREAAEAATSVARFLVRNATAIEALGERLRESPPALIVTCARGSSDHAATYAKYLFETLIGTTTTSAAFSTVSLYDAPVIPADKGVLCLAISQSGRSPDMLATVARQKTAGALVVALVNEEDSPLAELADILLPLCAGPELSVAATKSFITSLAGLAAIAAAWSCDKRMREALAHLPSAIDAGFALDWSAALVPLRDAPSLFVISRGFGLAIAQEAALKFKETSRLHGEAFSSAEVRHGPMAIVQQGFPVLAFDIGGIAGDDVRSICNDFARRGAHVWLATVSAAGTGTVTEAALDPAIGLLPSIAALPELAPIPMIAAFYRLANAVSLARGLEPDHPPFLAKVTRTR